MVGTFLPHTTKSSTYLLRYLIWLGQGKFNDRELSPLSPHKKKEKEVIRILLVMPRHLDHDWELEKPLNFWVHHFWDTIRVLGGWKGLLILFILMGCFYGFVVYTIEQGRKRREKQRMGKMR